MITITVGNPASFAIESGIHEAFAPLSLRALGYFIIHINGRCYGVKAWDATMLGCSFYTVLDRIAERGTHTAPFMEASAVDLIDAYLEVCYIGDREHELFFGQAAQSLSKIFLSSLGTGWRCSL